MSILIKGTEMPATGDFITLQICGDGTVRVVNKATGGVYTAPTFEEANGTDERIRARSVPTPHGRLKDADAAIMLLQKYYDRVGEPLKEHAIGECIMIIKDDVSTIIEAEE